MEMSIISIGVIKMKNKIFFIIFSAILLTIAGCQVTVGEKDLGIGIEAANVEERKISDYYPFLKNTLLVYKGEGMEYAEQKVYYEFIEDNLAQQKVISSGTNLVRILENKDGILSEVYVEGEFYHTENMLNTKKNRSNIILKEPLTIGNSWFTNEGNKKEISGLDVTIETPYKTFSALEVTTEYDEGNLLKDYYVKDLGLVARILTLVGIRLKPYLKM